MRFYRSRPDSELDEEVSKPMLGIEREAGHPRRVARVFDCCIEHAVHITNGLLLVIIGLIAVVYFKILDTSKCINDRPIARRFGNATEYMSLDHQYDYLWAPNLSGDDFAIQLPDSQSLPGKNGDIGAIPMFHQLHCLAGIRKALQRAHDGEDIGMDYRDDGHWPHCLHYLRETFLCNADASVERAILPDGSVGASFISGAWDVRHCRDNGPLYTLRDENKLEMPDHHH